MEIDAAIARPGQSGFSIERVRLDAPRPDEVRVRIAAVGLCHTDLFALHGGILPLPAVLGHEGAGVVEAVGAEVTKVKPGDRVLITFRSCGQCPNCAKGLASYCHALPMLNYIGVRLDGSRTHACCDGGEALAANFFGQSSLATHALTYERNLVVVPPALSLELAAPLGCGVQTGAGAIMRSLACPADSSVLILGGGSVGLAAVMGAVIQGCGSIIVLEPYEARRTLALELGAHHALDPAIAGDLPTAIRALLPAGVDFVLDTTGRPELQQAAMACLAPGGTLGLVGIAPPGTPPPGDANALLTFGHAIRGITEGDSDPDTFLPQLIALHLEGRLPFDRLVRTYRFADINQAIADQKAGLCIKPVLLMEESAHDPT